MERPIHKSPPRNEAKGKIFCKDAIENLPLQRLPSNRQIEDLKKQDFGYTTSSILSKLTKKDISLRSTFIDSKKLNPYKEDSQYPMISRFFFFPQDKNHMMQVEEINEKTGYFAKFDEQNLKEFIHLLQNLKKTNRFSDMFAFFSSENSAIRSICIQEMTEIILDIDHTQFSRKDLMKLYELGAVKLCTAITKTKKNFSIYQPLIQLGIIFNCFIYLEALKAKDDWIPCINLVKSTIHSKMKKSNQDVRVFAKTAKCIFDLEKLDLDDSSLFVEDMDDFVPGIIKKDNSIYIEGLAALFHTGNLILRKQSRFEAGVQRLVALSSFGSGDTGMVKWFHRLLGHFVVRMLQLEHPDVKLDVLDSCEDQLFAILKNDNFQAFDISHGLLFHHNEKVRSRFRELAMTKGVTVSKAITDSHIQTLLDKYGLKLDVVSSDSQLNNLVERKQCKFCCIDASITCFYEESTIADTYNTLAVKNIIHRKENLENELEVLKEIESKDFHINVARVLAFNQSFPKFYIKERLPGDNLQRRLLEAREKRNVIQTMDLIRIIIQAAEAVVYVHSQGCLLRDITTASYGCTMKNYQYFLKLKNFEMAAKLSDFPDGAIVNGFVDLDFRGVPIRWAAPESLLKGQFSIYSDVWSVNILADEILNYAAWPYSDISDADFDDIITHIVFTHLRPQGFNRSRLVHGLILEGLASVPEQRLKLQSLTEKLVRIVNKDEGEEIYDLYDTYSGVEGTRTKTYDIPPLTDRQRQANSTFERGIPASIQRYRDVEDPQKAFLRQATEKNDKMQEQKGVEVIDIFLDDNYQIESEANTNTVKVIERVTDDFLKFTYNRLNEIDSSKMCVEPWPPSKSGTTDGILRYNFPSASHLLDIARLKVLGEEAIGPYIELLYDLANYVDDFHSAGWIFRCLKAKNVWILETKTKEQTIVIPKFGDYRAIFSSTFNEHLEQIKVKSRKDTEGVQWLPIEAIKAGLYSKESDVYAFGMVTWEVMTAFGQDGAMYHLDEEQELICVPFNYQQSENILQHLIEGYIPDKPTKCPEWFYQEITRPCLLHQKIYRPSMKTILEILKKQLGKTLPKQIYSTLERSKVANQNEHLYDSPSNRQTSRIPPNDKDTTSSPMLKGKLNPKRNEDEHCSSESLQSFSEDNYESVDEVDESDTSDCEDHHLKTGLPVEKKNSNPPLPPRHYITHERKTTKVGPFRLPLPLPSPPPQPPPQLIDNENEDYNTDKMVSHKDGRRGFQPLQQPTDDQCHDYDYWDANLYHGDDHNESECDAGKKDTPPPIPPRYFIAHKKETAKEVLHRLPPPHSSSPQLSDSDNKYKGYVPDSSADLQLKGKLNQTSAKRDDNLIGDCEYDDNEYDDGISLKKNDGKCKAVKDPFLKLIPPTSQEISPRSIQNTLTEHDGNSLPRLSVSRNNTQSLDSRSEGRKNVNSVENRNSIYKSSDYYGNVSNVVGNETGDTIQGLDNSESVSKKIDVRIGSDIDQSVGIEENTNIKVVSSSNINTKPELLPKPKVKPKFTGYVNVPMENTGDTTYPIYVNEVQEQKKPPVPPRKPLGK